MLVRDSTLKPLLWRFPGVLDAIKAQTLELRQGDFSDFGDLSSHVLWTARALLELGDTAGQPKIACFELLAQH